MQKCQKHYVLDTKSLQVVELPTGTPKYVQNRHFTAEFEKKLVRWVRGAPRVRALTWCGRRAFVAIVWCEFAPFCTFLIFGQKNLNFVQIFTPKMVIFGHFRLILAFRNTWWRETADKVTKNHKHNSEWIQDSLVCLLYWFGTQHDTKPLLVDPQIGQN